MNIRKILAIVCISACGHICANNSIKISSHDKLSSAENMELVELYELARFPTKEEISSLKVVKYLKVTSVALNKEAFESISTLKTLECLQVQNCPNDSWNSVSILKDMDKLDSLKIDLCKGLNDKFMESLSEIENLKLLRIEKLEDVTCSGLNVLSRLPDLTSLNVSLHHLKKCDYLFLRKLVNLTHLRIGCSLADSAKYSSKLIESISYLSKIESLSLASFRSLGGLTLSDAKNISKLDKLKQFFVHIYDSPSFMVYVVENMNIETLYFTDLGGDNNCAFLGSLCKSSIVTLSLSGQSERLVSALKELTQATGITKLEISGSRMLSAILSQPKVWKSVSILKCHIVGEITKSRILELMKLPRIKDATLLGIASLSQKDIKDVKTKLAARFGIPVEDVVLGSVH